MCVTGDSSEAPEHGHSLADAHVLVVEVAEASEGEGRQDVQPRVGHLNGDVSMHIISYHLAQTPKREKSSNQQRSCTEIHPLCGSVLPGHLKRCFFHLLPSAFPEECSVPTQGASIAKTKQNKTFHTFY